MRKVILLLISLFMFCLICVGCNNNDIFILGNVEDNLEIYTEYSDPGIAFPEKYTLVTDGKIDNTKLGKQQIKYYLYSDSGELVKELHRFVNVIDSTPPTYIEAAHLETAEFYVGQKYVLSNFVSDYEDNYCSKDKITVSRSEFVFDNAGTITIEIIFEDSLGNQSTLTKSIRVVEDQTPPNFVPNNLTNAEFHIGQIYDISCFVFSYTDNLTSKENIVVTPSKIVFNNSGIQTVSIDFIDESGNKSTFSAKINVKEIDFEALINDVYKNQSNKVSTGTNGIGSNYISVDIDRNTSFSYYDSGSLHYLQKVETALGTYASIQISADYGEFDKANVSFHISNYGNTYSVGFATIDARNTDVTVSQFRSSINNLNLDNGEMLKELNAHLNGVLENFHDYMNNTLKLEVR
ncbi:MAG: hypothetical protein E7609_04630 [Ruminococcaceae bacterium]|nr:hypothetical protein [Oscillospiraceae bacterium]